MIKNTWVQIMLSLLLGGMVFYMVAPHSSELGVIAYEPKVVLIVIGSCLLMLSFIKLCFRKISWSVSSISTVIAVIAMVFLYPPSSRLDEPNNALKDKINSYLIHEAEFEVELLSINHRPRRMFDMFRDKYWLASINCSDTRQTLYIKQPLFGDIYSESELVCKK